MVPRHFPLFGAIRAVIRVWPAPCKTKPRTNIVGLEDLPLRARIYSWLFPFGALLLAPLSCTDDDEHCGAEDKMRCVDNEQQFCDHEREQWDDVGSCYQRYCRVKPNGYTQCADNPEPDARCTEADERWCVDSARIAICDGGYLRESSCFEGGVCIESLGDALCVAASASPDPRCPAEPGDAGFCEGDTLVSCRSGYLGDERSCGDRGCPEGCMLVAE